MGVVLNPSSEQAKELRKWEQHPTRLSMTEDGSFAPGNPYAYRPYPRMLYRAVKQENGKVVCMPPLPNVSFFRDQADYLMAYAQAEAVQAETSKIAESEAQERELQRHGWCESPAAALAAFERKEQETAAEMARAYHAAQRMSDKARTELEQVNDEAGLEHVPDVTPAVKKRVREQAQG